MVGVRRCTDLPCFGDRRRELGHRCPPRHASWALVARHRPASPRPWQPTAASACVPAPVPPRRAQGQATPGGTAAPGGDARRGQDPRQQPVLPILQPRSPPRRDRADHMVAGLRLEPRHGLGAPTALDQRVGVHAALEEQRVQGLVTAIGMPDAPDMDHLHAACAAMRRPRHGARCRGRHGRTAARRCRPRGAGRGPAIAGASFRVRRKGARRCSAMCRSKASRRQNRTGGAGSRRRHSPGCRASRPAPPRHAPPHREAPGS